MKKTARLLKELDIPLAVLSLFGPHYKNPFMRNQNAAMLSIVDYGLGNLFSVLRACESAGAAAIITHSKQEILDSSGVILPGVGAFGVAMHKLSHPT